jgi:hypothetical protein
MSELEPLTSDEEVDDRRLWPRPGEDERRGEGRQRTILSGLVLFPDEETGRSVTILNRSAAGAKLRFGDVGLLPQRFTLLDQRAGLAHLCLMVWRSMPLVGVRFERTLDLSVRDEKLLRQLKTLWGATRP